MKFLDELRKLDLNKEEFVIFGSGPLSVRKIRENSDIDILVTEKLWNDLISLNKYELIGNELKLSKNISAYVKWEIKQITEQEIIENKEIIDELPFAKLKYVKIWKEEKARPKDLEDLKLMKEILNM